VPRLHKRELAEILHLLPEAKHCRPETEPQGRSESLFLCALGFEERCLTLPARLAASGYRADHAIYLQYETNSGDNESRLPSLLTALNVISDDVQKFRYDEPGASNLLVSTLRSFDPAHTPAVTFDISVTSNRFLIRALRHLLSFNIRLRLVYSEAEIYHPTEDEYKTDPSRWTHDPRFGTEHGVAEIVPLVEYSGHLDSLPDFIIVFPSFKPDRARAVINDIDPSLVGNPSRKVLWLVGVPHLSENFWRVEAMRQINQLGSVAQQMEISTFDYKQTLRVLDSTYDKVKNDYNISIVPFGSKLQSVAVALFCTMHPELRVVSAIPYKYGTLFSEGFKQTWEIDYGATQDVRNILAEVGELSISD
jgi:hypothetical protein